MISIHTQRFYERFTGTPHDITVTFDYPGRKVYEVRLDGEFYSNHESKREAFDEIVDILRAGNLSAVRPF